MNLDLEGLLLGEAQRLRYITRFSTCFVQHKESVAEHSYFTSFFALMLADYVRDRGYDISYPSLMRKVLLHDLEEARTGDIFRPFKHSTPELEEAIHDASMDAVAEVIDSFCPGDREALANYRYDWESSKDGSLEGRIVRFADFLSVLSYMCQEVKAQNGLMKEHVGSIKAYAEEFLNHVEEYKFIETLLYIAVDLAKRFFPEEYA